MPKPVIGLTTICVDYRDKLPIFAVNQPYVRSIAKAGGLPVLIPNDLPDEDLEQLLDILDGILFTGGYDIDPIAYGSSPHPKVEHIDAERDRMESYLVQAAVRKGKPFLGICRGLQVIDVSLGGTLYEDISDQLSGDVQHDNHDKPRDYLAHAVRIEKNTRLDEIIPCDQIQVNSLHHQGINQLASPLRASAFSPDGLVEAIELPEARFGLAVQWHPEELQEYASMRRLFQSFIESCQSVNPASAREINSHER